MIRRFLALILVISHSLTYANQCPQGQVYDNTLNRCVLSQSTVNNATEALECDGLTGDAYRECFDKNVNDEMAEAEADGDVQAAQSPEEEYIVPGLVVLGAGVVLFKKQDILKDCSSTSVWLMLGGGVTSILGEMMAQKKYEDKTKDLMKQYKEDVEDTTLEENEDVERISTNQTRAFDFQIQQEEARKTAHDARKKTYNMAMGLYSAASIAAIIEGFSADGWGASAACGIGDTPAEETPPASGESSSSSDGNHPGVYTPFNLHNALNVKALAVINKDLFQDYSYLDRVTYPEYLEIVKRNIVGSLTIQQARAEGGFLSSIFGAESAAGDMIHKAVASPAGRAVIAGVLAIYAKKVAKKAGDLADISEKRIEVLTELRNSFLANGGAGLGQCTEADRRSPSKPFCFCYDSKGQQDQSKKDNKVCTTVWNNSNFNMIAGRYGKNVGESAQGIQGCLRRNGILDPGCNCRKEKDKNSAAACTNITGTLSLGGLAGLQGLPGMVNDAANFANGTMSTGDLADGSTVNSLVGQIDKKKEELAKNPKYEKTMKKIADSQVALQRQVGSRVAQGLRDGSLKNPFENSGLGEDPNAGKSAKEILADTTNQVEKLEQSFTKMGVAGTVKKKNFDFNLNSGDGSVEVDNELAGVMKKDFDYGSGAINQDPGKNIFQIISVRYQRSGLRRLFDEEGKSQADEANKNVINQN